MKAIVKNLQNQTGMQGERSLCKCFICGGEYSANKGDYWMADANQALKCCGKTMEIVMKRTVYTAL